MRKMLLALGLATVMLSAPVMASDTDYSAMSTDELIAMRSAITEEINSRLSDAVSPIGSGSYVCGQDIKPGTYLITDAKPQGLYFSCFIYNNEDDLREGKDIGDRNDSCFVDEGGTMTVSLHDGQIMLIDGEAMMQEYEPSWAMD